MTFHDEWRAIFHEICHDRFVPARYWLRDDRGRAAPLRQISWKKTTPNNLETQTFCLCRVPITPNAGRFTIVSIRFLMS